MGWRDRDHICIAAPLHCCITALLHCCIAALLHRCIAALLLSFIAALLHRCIDAVDLLTHSSSLHPAFCCCAPYTQLAYQPEYHLGWRDHDQIYMAWQVFGELFFNDSSAVR